MRLTKSSPWTLPPCTWSYVWTKSRSGCHTTIYGVLCLWVRGEGVPADVWSDTDDRCSGFSFVRWLFGCSMAGGFVCAIVVVVLGDARPLLRPLCTMSPATRDRRLNCPCWERRHRCDSIIIIKVCMHVCMYDYIAVSTRTFTPPTTGTE